MCKHLSIEWYDPLARIEIAIDRDRRILDDTNQK